MPVLPSYRNQSIICTANQLTDFYMTETLAFNGLRSTFGEDPNICWNDSEQDAYQSRVMLVFLQFMLSFSTLIRTPSASTSHTQMTRDNIIPIVLTGSFYYRSFQQNISQLEIVYYFIWGSNFATNVKRFEPN